MKKKIILVFIIVILILLIPTYSKYSEKKEINQLEKDFIAEFYIRAQNNYPIYKKVIETKQHLNGEESYLFDDNDYKIKNIIEDSREFQKKYKIEDSRLNTIEEYYKITLDSDTEYNRFLLDKSINFNYIQKYIDTVDKVIKQYKLDPLSIN